MNFLETITHENKEFGSFLIDLYMSHKWYLSKKDKQEELTDIEKRKFKKHREFIIKLLGSDD